jgi:hypothetical protein
LRRKLNGKGHRFATGRNDVAKLFGQCGEGVQQASLICLNSGQRAIMLRTMLRSYSLI